MSRHGPSTKPVQHLLEPMSRAWKEPPTGPRPSTRDEGFREGMRSLPVRSTGEVGVVVKRRRAKRRSPVKCRRGAHDSDETSHDAVPWAFDC